MTLDSLITRWLRDRERDGCSASTLRVYRSRTNTLRAALGDRDCATLSRDDLLDWLDTETHWPGTGSKVEVRRSKDNHAQPSTLDRSKVEGRGLKAEPLPPSTLDRSKVEGRGLKAEPLPPSTLDLPPSTGRKAPDTIRLILTVLKMLQEFALDREAIAAPWLKAKDFKKPKGRRRERLPTSTETQQLLAIASPEFALIYNALRLTGARPGELSGARIEQIRTEGRRRTLVIADHKTAHKTGQDRKIPIGKDVAPYFDRAIGGRSEGPIFTRADGSGWTRTAITSNFRRLRRQLGLDESLKLYSARHEFITAVSRKHGIGRAKYLAGHSSINTTQRYDHPTDAELHAAQSGLYGEPDEPHDASALSVVPLPPVPDREAAGAVGDVAADRAADRADDRADDQPPEPVTGDAA